MICDRVDNENPDETLLYLLRRILSRKLREEEILWCLRFYFSRI